MSGAPTKPSGRRDSASEALRARDVTHAAARGVVGAMAMTGIRAATGGLDIVQDIPPQAIIRQRLLPPLRKVPRARRDALIELAHWGYGGAGGAVYGALPAAIRNRWWTGAGYGIAIWLGFELVIAPALKLQRPRRGRRLRQHAALAADHLLYGLVVSEIRPAHKATR